MVARMFSSIEIPANMRANLIPLYVWETLGGRLRVNEKVRQSVVFVGIETESGFLPYGTALLGIASYEDMGQPVAITARHVMDDIPGDFVSIRVNRKDGSSGTIKVKKSLTITFKDKATDLAVLPIHLDHAIYDVYAIPLQSAARQWQVKSLGEPSFGDEICVVGLYTTHYGHIRNIPIVRVGHIAAMPEEQVMTDRGYVVGYLIECHSIAGLSGSPVYWNVPQLRLVNGVIQTFENPNYMPLGILIGYHVIESKDDEIIVPQFQQSPERRKESKPSKQTDERRTGFAVVLPIQLIYKLFESDEMQKILKTAVEGARQRSGYRTASAVPPLEVDLPVGDENPNHLKDFKRLVDVAGRKRPRGDQT